MMRCASIILASFISTAAAAAPVPSRLSVQGGLETSGGVPASGTYDVTLRLFAAEAGGSSLYTQAVPDLVVSGGLFDVELGLLPDGLFNTHGVLWLEVTVGADTLPRRPLRPAPWALVANQAHEALGLACSGCVSGAEVDFPYALGTSKGGAATDIECTGCVSSAELEAGAVATVHVQAGAVSTDKVAFNYAGSLSKGGAATDVACVGCVTGGEIVANAALSGTVSVSGGLTTCTGGGPCTLRVGGPALADPGNGWLTVQASSGLRVRDAADSAWRPADVGGLTSYGAVTVSTGDVLVQSGMIGVGGTPAAGVDVRRQGVALAAQNTTDSASVQVAQLAAGDRVSPQPGDSAYVSFQADDAGGKRQERARLTWVQTSPVNGAEDAGIRIHISRNGALTEALRAEFDATHAGTFAINPAAVDMDTRIGTAGDSAAVLIDGATGRVGIGTAAPQSRLHVAGTVTLANNEIKGLRAENAAGAPVACDTDHRGYLYFDTGNSGFYGCDGATWKLLSGSSSPATPRTINSFTGFLGPDLSGEGLTQCYGWRNDGSGPGATYSEIRSACGSSTTLAFAGYRAGSTTLIRHDMKLGRPFINYMPSSFPGGTTYYQVFDAESKFSWFLSNPWILLVTYGNGWSDPGRLWEVHASGGTSADSGHVLSQTGGNAHDQSNVLGDSYFIYGRFSETYNVVDGFTGFYGPDLSSEGLVQCYGWWNDGATPGASYADIRARCGAGTTVVFAGTRAGSASFIRHDAQLSQPFIGYLPSSFPSYCGAGCYTLAFDTQSKYSWYLGNPWLLLVKRGNGWSDPGRLWEVHGAGGASASDGHVLSQNGDNGLDQANYIGDKYYIYINE